MWLLFKSSSLI